jgi:V/A-type H+-transporting ATPase subunit C
VTPLTTAQHEWGFVCGRISVLEGRLLPDEFFQTLISHRGTDDVIRMLQDTALKESLHPGVAWEDFGKLIDEHFHAQVVSLRENCPDPVVADMALLRNDYINVKRALLGETEAACPTGRYDAEGLRVAAGGDWNNLSQEVQDAIAPIETERGKIDRLSIDLALDAAYLRELLRMAGSTDSPVIVEHTAFFVLVKAVIALLRTVRVGKSTEPCKNHFLPLGVHTEVLRDLFQSADPKSWPDLLPGELALLLREAIELPPIEQAPRFEQLAMNWLKEIAGRGTDQIAGPERVFSYLSALEAEAYNLKLVVSGRMSRVGSDLLRQRLRECHV